jgi:hypothetical protein
MHVNLVARAANRWRDSETASMRATSLELPVMEAKSSHYNYPANFGPARQMEFRHLIGSLAASVRFMPFTQRSMYSA